MYYSKCHGELPLPGIFRFSANCRAPTVLLLLLVAEVAIAAKAREINPGETVGLQIR
jgi:hypothetical protein